MKPRPRFFACAFAALFTLCIILWGSAPPPRAVAPHLLCSHQGRLHPDHRPVAPSDLLPSLRKLLGLGVRCFDLDLSPLPGGGSAVAHPAALAAAAAAAGGGGGGGGGAPATAGFAEVLALLGGAPGGAAVLTLELKGALGEDGALVRAIGGAAAAAGLQGRVALLGVPAGARLPPGLLRATAVRDADGCAEAAALSRDVAVAMPSAACWRDAGVRARVAAWAPAAAAAAAAAGAAPELRGAVAVWPVDDAGAAAELAALGAAGAAAGAGALRFVTNAPQVLLQGAAGAPPPQG